MGHAIVRVWWFGKGSVGRTVAINLGAGHGSVEVHPDKDRSTYITWAARGPRPGAFASSRSSRSSYESSHGSAASSIGVERSNQYRYDDDKRAYGDSNNPRQEDWSCTLPLRGASNASFCGLDGGAMVNWWDDMLTEGLGKYKAISKDKNCDAITVAALVAGGADCYASPPWNLLYQGAYTLVQWVSEVSQKMRSMNNEFSQARQVLLNVKSSRMMKASRRAPRNARDRMPTEDEWKKQSRVMFGARHEQIAKIDKYLSDYWTADHQSVWTKSAMKRKALINILHQVYLHITLKRNSRRRGAVIDLGNIVLRAALEQNQHLTSTYNDAQRELHNKYNRAGPYQERIFDIQL